MAGAPTRFGKLPVTLPRVPPQKRKRRFTAHYALAVSLKGWEKIEG